MSETIYVKIPVECSRTKKLRDEKIPLDQVETYLAQKRLREQSAEDVEKYLSTLTALPDLVCVYKGRVCVLPTVSDKNDGTVNRLFAQASNSDMFPVPAPKPRKSSKKKAGGGKSTSEGSLE